MIINLYSSKIEQNTIFFDLPTVYFKTTLLRSRAEVMIRPTPAGRDSLKASTRRF